MSDEADAGNDNAELFLRAALANRRHEGLISTGFCFYCDEPVRQGVLFCTSECSHDWHVEQRINRIKGQ